MGWLKDQARGFLDSISKFNTRLKNGYLQFFDSVKGTWAWVHRKVAEIMTGETIPPGHEVHHVNRDKLDNDPSNLEVLTKEEHQDVHRNEYSDRVNRINEKLSRVKKKTRTSKLRKPSFRSTPNLQENIQKIINAEKVRINHFFNTFRSSGFSSGSCPRCGGTGYLPQFSHVANGVCFLCGGSRTVDNSSFEDFEPEDFFNEDDWNDYNFGKFDDYYDKPYDDYEPYDSYDNHYDDYDDPLDEPFDDGPNESDSFDDPYGGGYDDYGDDYY